MSYRHEVALLTLDEARNRLGIGRAALLSAISRGDLIQVELEGNRGATRRYITTVSVHAWIMRMNGEDGAETEEATPAAQHNISEASHTFIGLGLREVTEKVDKVLSRISKAEEQREQNRRMRLRHTVSSRIGDAFDPHGHYVYLLWGDNDETPLYIGKSRNVLGRLGSHMTNNDRRHIVKSVQLIKCSGEATMNRTEAALIREYKPTMNIVGVREFPTVAS